MPVLDARENNDDQTDARPTSVWEGRGQQMMYDDVMSNHGSGMLLKSPGAQHVNDVVRTFLEQVNCNQPVL